MGLFGNLEEGKRQEARVEWELPDGLPRLPSLRKFEAMETEVEPSRFLAA